MNALSAVNQSDLRGEALVRVMSMCHLSKFQEQCESRLHDSLASLGLDLITQHIRGREELFIVGSVPKLSLKIWIYENEAMFTLSEVEYVYEALDYPEQDIRLNTIIDAVMACAKGDVPADTGSGHIILFKGPSL